MTRKIDGLQQQILSTTKDLNWLDLNSRVEQTTMLRLARNTRFGLIGISSERVTVIVNELPCSIIGVPNANVKSCSFGSATDLVCDTK